MQSKIQEAKQFEAHMFAETKQLEANFAFAEQAAVCDRERAEEGALARAEADAAGNQQREQAAMEHLRQEMEQLRTELATMRGHMEEAREIGEEESEQ